MTKKAVAAGQLRELLVDLAAELTDGNPSAGAASSVPYITPVKSTGSELVGPSSPAVPTKDVPWR